MESLFLREIRDFTVLLGGIKWCLAESKRQNTVIWENEIVKRGQRRDNKTIIHG